MSTSKITLNSDCLDITSEKSIHYFAGDGNYGSAENMAVIVTSGWTESDWTELEETPDSSRVHVALDISHRRNLGNSELGVEFG